jgi:serine/threonine protein kinase
MAEVFEAELTGHLGFVRKVAIKRMLETAAADPTAAQRFLDEATIASRLHHANVISVVDFGLLDDRPFQVLELVDGIDAHRLVQRAGGKLPLEVAVAIASDVAHALDHAHSATDAAGLPLGIVHRDVKPSNVLLSWGGDVKLGDFGIAVAHNRAATTEAGVVAGTLGFIAPEQRQRGTLDGRTDVFALGLTLHALITGASPLADIEIEMRVLSGDPVPLDASVPDDVREILSRALATALTARPTAGELATQLGAVLAPRLKRDARSLLRDFLARHAPRSAPRQGALDALLGIEVVLTNSSDENIHRYETRSASHAATIATGSVVPTTPATPRGSGSPKAADHASADHASADHASAVDAPTSGTGLPAPGVVEPQSVPRDAPTQPTTSTPKVELDDEPPPRRRAGPIALAIIGLGTAGGIALWQLRGSSSNDPAIGSDATALAAALDANQPDATRTPVQTPAPLEVDAVASGVDAAAHDATPSRARDAAIVARQDARGIDAVAIDAVPSGNGPSGTGQSGNGPSGPGPSGTGYIQVLGENLIGASVIIDGRNVGSVPNAFPVALGSHRVEVEKRDGTRLPVQTIDVTATHNRANPVHPTW